MSAKPFTKAFFKVHLRRNDRWIAKYPHTFDTKREADEAALEWFSERDGERLTHVDDEYVVSKFQGLRLVKQWSVGVAV